MKKNSSHQPLRAFVDYEWINDNNNASMREFEKIKVVIQSGGHLQTLTK